MNKKIFGIKIGTYLTVICCFIVAVLFWLFVKYSESLGGAQEVVAQIRGSIWI